MITIRSKKSIFFCVLLLLIGVNFITLTGGISENIMDIPIFEYQDNTIYVNDDNIDGPWNGTQENPYQYIQDGINAAQPGETVFVFNGIYYEIITIDKTINLVGENTNTTIIDGGGTGRIIRIVADYVNISGFTIQNGYYWTSGIDISMANHIHITKNRIEESGGITLFDSSSNTITENTIENSNFGIAILMSRTNVVSSNTIENNDYGIYMFFIADYNNIKDNRIIDNNEGIYMCGASNNTVTRNNITHNNQGIRVIGWSNNNSYYLNNFINNTQHAYDECINIWNKENPIRGNYWDDYNGTDDNGDGMGDTPYVVPGGNNQDGYPLMRPWTPVLCGDVNEDGIVNVSDAVFIINYVFIPGAPSPDPICVGDANGDGYTNVSDAVWIINYVFIPDSPPPVDDCC